MRWGLIALATLALLFVGGEASAWESRWCNVRPVSWWGHGPPLSRHLPAGIPHYVGYRVVPDGPDSRALNNLAYDATRIIRRGSGACR